MSRRLARETAMKLLFQFEFNEEDKDQQMEKMFDCIKEGQMDELIQFADSKEKIEINLKDELFIRRIVEGVMLARQLINDIIKKHSVGWKLARIPLVELSILRIAIYEILYCDDIPVNVSINESIELAKKFCGDSAAPFINAVLGKIAKADVQNIMTAELQFNDSTEI